MRHIGSIPCNGSANVPTSIVAVTSSPAPNTTLPVAGKASYPRKSAAVNDGDNENTLYTTVTDVAKLPLLVTTNTAVLPAGIVRCDCSIRTVSDAAWLKSEAVKKARNIRMAENFFLTTL